MSTLADLTDERMAHARDQLHWAVQVLGATCDAALERRADDSQSALLPGTVLGNAALADAITTEALPSGHRLALDPAGHRLLVVAPGVGIESDFVLAGRSLEDALGWVHARLPDLDRPPSPRDYELPDHAYGTGGAYDDADAEAIAAMCHAIRHAFELLGSIVTVHGAATALRLWPHHFDLGSILLLSPEGNPASDPCVGIGYSFGDATLTRPYFYANPYGIERRDPLPALPAGEWTTAWYGAVLECRTLDTEAAEEAVREMTARVLTFVRAAVGGTQP